ELLVVVGLVVGNGNQVSVHPSKAAQRVTPCPRILAGVNREEALFPCVSNGYAAQPGFGSARGSGSGSVRACHAEWAERWNGRDGQPEDLVLVMDAEHHQRQGEQRVETRELIPHIRSQVDRRRQ